MWKRAYEHAFPISPISTAIWTNKELTTFNCVFQTKKRQERCSSKEENSFPSKCSCERLAGCSLLIVLSPHIITTKLQPSFDNNSTPIHIFIFFVFFFVACLIFDCSHQNQPFELLWCLWGSLIGFCEKTIPTFWLSILNPILQIFFLWCPVPILAKIHLEIDLPQKLCRKLWRQVTTWTFLCSKTFKFTSSCCLSACRVAQMSSFTNELISFTKKIFCGWQRTVQSRWFMWSQVKYICSPTATGKSSSILPAFLASEELTHYVYIARSNNGRHNFSFGSLPQEPKDDNPGWKTFAFVLAQKYPHMTFQNFENEVHNQKQMNTVESFCIFLFYFFSKEW